MVLLWPVENQSRQIWSNNKEINHNKHDALFGAYAFASVWVTKTRVALNKMCLSSKKVSTKTFLLISPQCRVYSSVNWDIIGVDNGLSPIRRQVII